MKRIDDLENLHTQAFQTALAGAHDKKGKPIYKSFKDMFDRSKYEEAMLGDLVKKKKVRAETVEKFRKSKEHAENVLNGIAASPIEEQVDSD